MIETVAIITVTIILNIITYVVLSRRIRDNDLKVRSELQEQLDKVAQSLGPQQPNFAGSLAAQLDSLRVENFSVFNKQKGHRQ